MSDNGLTPLTELTPAKMAVAGYGGDARYVAFFWNHRTGAAMWFDGVAAGTAAWPVLMAYDSRLPVLASGPGNEHNLGATGTPTEHWLIIDAEELKAYIAPVGTAWVFVHQQHAPPFPPETVREIVAAFEQAATRESLPR